MMPTASPSPLSSRTVGIVTPAASRSAVSRLLSEGDIRLIVEDAGAGNALDGLRGVAGSRWPTSVRGIRDVHDLEVRKLTRAVVVAEAEGLTDDLTNPASVSNEAQRDRDWNAFFRRIATMRSGD